MKYYLHDANSFNDEKITELYINFGYEGLGLFYTLLEKIALQEKPIKTAVLKKQLNVGKRLEKCWSFMEEIELILTKDDETFNEQLLNFSGKYAIKKEKTRKRISEWREKQADTKNVTCYKSVRNTDKVNKSKVNKSKDNISNIIGEKQKLVFPYNSEKFMLLWNELVKMPKWRKKPFSALQLTLHKLSEFEEEFVIELIENAITGNYQGIIFNNTKEKYEQFKQQKYGGENIRNNAKKQGVSKQELAEVLYEHFQNRDNSGE